MWPIHLGMNLHHSVAFDSCGIYLQSVWRLTYGAGHSAEKPAGAGGAAWGIPNPLKPPLAGLTVSALYLTHHT